LAGLPPQVRHLAAALGVASSTSLSRIIAVTRAQAGSVIRGKESSDADTRLLGRCVLDILVRRGIIRRVDRRRRPHRYLYEHRLLRPFKGPAAASEGETGPPLHGLDREPNRKEMTEPR